MVVTQEHKAFVLARDRVGRVSIPVAILDPTPSNDSPSKGYHRSSPNVQACVVGGKWRTQNVLKGCSFMRGPSS